MAVLWISLESLDWLDDEISESDEDEEIDCEKFSLFSVFFLFYMLDPMFKRIVESVYKFPKKQFSSVSLILYFSIVQTFCFFLPWYSDFFYYFFGFEISIGLRLIFYSSCAVIF